MVSLRPSPVGADVTEQPPLKTYSRRRPRNSMVEEAEISSPLPKQESVVDRVEAFDDDEHEDNTVVVTPPAGQQRGPAVDQTTPAPEVVASPRTAFLTNITKPVETVLQVPAAPKRRKKTLPSNFVPRRSRRVANLPPQVDHKAASTVCRQLGFTEENTSGGIPPMEMYARVFDQPLNQNHLKALAALFGWNAPACGVNQAAGCSSAA